MEKEIIRITNNLESIVFNEEDGTLSLHWHTGGHENATCGIKFKIELIEKIKSTYKAPHIPYNPDYNEAF